MPHDFSPQQLLALRDHIGFTQVRLAVALNSNLNTVRSHEKIGTSDRNYVERLIDLVEVRAHLPPARKPRKGWPDKPWKLAQRSHTFPPRYCFLLYMEGHRDDMKPLRGRPEPSESVTAWLERPTYKHKIWDYLAIRPDGTVDQWGAFFDKDLSYW